MIKTDFEQQWGRPTARQLAKEKYSKGKYFFEMLTPQEKSAIKPVNLELSDLKRPSALKLIMVKASKDINTCAIRRLMDSLINQVELNIEKYDCEACLEKLFVFSDDKLIYKNTYDLEKKIKRIL